MSPKPVVFLGSVFLLASVLFLHCFSACKTAPPIEITSINPTLAFTGSIFISGAVNNPGLYLFGPQDTLGNLLQAAGGLKEGATLSQVTLTIPDPGSDASPQRININTADAWLLAALPGIGDTYAKAIVSYRTEHGPFATIADLSKIKGIGPATQDKIRALITVS